MVLRPLAASASTHIHTALSAATTRSYSAMFRVYLGFLCFYGILQDQVNVDVFITFLEFLHKNNKSPAMIQNYVSAVKSQSAMYGLPVTLFSDQKVAYFIKSLHRQAPLRFTLKPIMNIETLSAFVKQCDKTPLGKVFKAMYLVAYFSFLRLSNLVPHSIAAFSYKKHLTQDDIFFKTDSAVCLVKWSKTMQLNDKVKLITIPKLDNCLCPVAALREVLRISPRFKNAPLFQHFFNSTWLPLTDTRVRAHLRDMLSAVGLAASAFTFHSFRRSGATFAFQNNVELQNIKNHGTWSTDCVWRYVVDSADAGSEVAKKFASLLS